MGATWTAAHRTPHEIMPNATWRMATTLRLGLSFEPSNARCQLRSAAPAPQNINLNLRSNWCDVLICIGGVCGYAHPIDATCLEVF